jgi:hypothetical protein
MNYYTSLKNSEYGQSVHLVLSFGLHILDVFRDFFLFL